MYTFSLFPSCFCQGVCVKLGEYGLGEYGFSILSVTIQVRTVERALTVGSIKLSMVRFICFGVFLWFVFFFSFNYPQIEVFEHVTAIKHIQYTNFFQLKWASFLKMIQSPRPFLEQNKQNIFAVRLYHSKISLH